MENHRGSESDDGDARSGSPGSQGEENDERQAMLNRNGGGSTSSNKMTRCMVCKELTDNHHVHYGALCCFSCRAFFRRANQRTKKSSYVCKQDGKCDVSYKNRKKCQKCRYEACLIAGMDPNLVLTEEQKKARFRKKSEKRGDNGRQISETDLHHSVRPSDPGTNGRGGGLTGQKKRRRTGENSLPRDDIRSPELCDEISTHNNPNSFYDDFELMLQRSSSYGTTRLQSDTLRDLEGTLAMAHEMNSMSRTDPHGSSSAFLNFANLATDRIQHHACEPSSLIRSPNHITKKLSAPQYGQWSFSPYQQQQQQLHQQHLQQQQQQQLQLIVPKQEEYTLQILQSPQHHFQQLSQTYHHHLQQQQQPQNLIQQQIQHTVHAAALNHMSLQHQPQPPQQIHLEVPHILEDILPTAEDLLGDPALRPLGIDNVLVGQQHLIAPYCSSPMFGSSVIGSPLSTSSSLLNTPVATPGVKAPQNVELPASITGEEKPAIAFSPSVVEVKHETARLETPSPDCDKSSVEQLISDFGGVQSENDLVYRLVSFHSGTIHLSEYDIGRIIFNVGENFRQFAVKQPTFQELSVTDQCHLLTTNQPLFIHYILGRYFTAKQGIEQVQWLIGPIDNTNADPALRQMLTSVEHISLKVFNRDAALFSDQSCMRRYLEKAESGLSNLSLDLKHNGLIAALLLYNATNSDHCEDGESDLSSVRIVNDQFAHLMEVIRKSEYSLQLPSDLEKFVNVIYELKSIFLSQPGDVQNGDSMQYNWCGAGEVNRLAKELGMPYTREEEDWLVVQLAKYSSAYREVPMGEDYVNEFIMFSYDVPLSKHFVYRGYATFAERFRRVLKTQPGFNDLNDRDQALVWKQGCAKSVACCFVKSENCPTGNDQLQFMFGELDRNNWQTNYATQVAVTKVNKIKKVLMTDCNKISATYDTEELMDYLRLVGTLGEVTSYTDIFPILTLIALLSGEGLTSEGARFATDMRNKYFTVLGRKLSGDRRAYSSICLGLNEIDELSLLMKKLET